ncbi:MAG: exo-beta-N-acetylmuramidase NamZ domain-containing protein [Candidatus Kapaibacteriota bacterium]
MKYCCRRMSLVLLTLLTMIIAVIDVPNALSQGAFRYDVKNGVDVLILQNFALFEGKKIVLVTNQSGRTRGLQSTLDAFLQAKNCTIGSILTPEHGYYGLARAGEIVKDSNETIRGIKAISLFGKDRRRPSQSMIEGFDAVVFDIQDIGLRGYTYLSTLYWVMDACAEYNKPLYILDRPNPLGGKIIDGAVLDTAFISFVGIVPVPYIHGCTLGEMAMMINGEGWLQRDGATGKPRKCPLTIIRAEGWQRWMTWEDTDFTWIPTSPYIPNVESIRGMALTGVYGELSLFNIGIGYVLPFQMIGTPNLNVPLLLEGVKKQNLTSITMIPTRYRPFYGKFANTDCNGILFAFAPDAIRFKPFSAGLDIMLALRALQPELFQIKQIPDDRKAMFAKVCGTDKIFDALFVKKTSDEEVRRLSQRGVKEFTDMRKKYLLYD